jgi:protein-disulfide isomerase
MEQYQQCMSTEKYRPQIQANAEQGVRLGIDRTPSFIFGSKRLPGVLPYDEFRARVDTMIAEARAAKGTKQAK